MRFSWQRDSAHSARRGAVAAVDRRTQPRHRTDQSPAGVLDAAEQLGIEIIVGAFLAGAIVALLRTSEDRELTSQLEAIGFGFFIPIFFIMVGVDFNLPALLASSDALVAVPLLLIAAVAVKILPALVFGLNHSWRASIAAGIPMCPRLSLLIAAAAIGKKLGIIDESVNGGIVLVAIVTVTSARWALSRIPQ